MGQFGVLMGHPTAMSPFNRARTTSYSCLIETMLICIYLVSLSRCSNLPICRNSPTVAYKIPHLMHFGAPVEGDSVRTLKNFGVRKLDSLRYRMPLFAFSYV